VFQRITASVTASLEAVDGEVLVRIMDDGPGFPPDENERLFELFFRSAQTARVAAGAGIGLFVCARLIKAMGGRIWAASRPEEAPSSASLSGSWARTTERRAFDRQTLLRQRATAGIDGVNTIEIDRPIIAPSRRSDGAKGQRMKARIPAASTSERHCVFDEAHGAFLELALRGLKLRLPDHRSRLLCARPELRRDRPAGRPAR